MEKKVRIELQDNRGTVKDIRMISLQTSQTVLQLCQDNHIYISAVCNGKGTCGQCKVQFIKGAPNPENQEEKRLTKEELNSGWRLACKAFLPVDSTQEVVVRIPLLGEEQIQIPFQEEPGIPSLGKKQTQISSLEERLSTLDSSEEKPDQAESSLGVAVDIGTTTLGLQLYDLESKQLVGNKGSINHQRSFGADVLSRIQASNAGHQKELQRILQEDLRKGILGLLEDKKQRERDQTLQQKGQGDQQDDHEDDCQNDRIGTENEVQSDWNCLKRICIAGNTTMIHLLLGYSCQHLGSFPFTPVDLDPWEVTLSGLPYFQGTINVYPSISAYLGGDLTAGLAQLKMESFQEPALFLDLGTNGEMAIGNRDLILAASTAAGPAFEGGNIRDGMSSLPGAICKVTIYGGRAVVKTIGDQIPQGICGTGLLDAVAELRMNGLVDETGLLEEEYFEEGFPLAQTAQGKWVSVTQKDIREFQMAKAAIRGGLELLIARYGQMQGKSPAQVMERLSHFYLAGGMGATLDGTKAARVGVFPRELEQKVSFVGNTSLKGAAALLNGEVTRKELLNLKKKTKELVLANEPEFQQTYLDGMKL